MSQPAPLTLAQGEFQIADSPILRVRECTLTLHAEHETLVPSRTGTDRQLVPAARWLEVRAVIEAAAPLQGLAWLDAAFAALLRLGAHTLTISEAHLIGYSAQCEQSQILETITIRCERWTLAED